MPWTQNLKVKSLQMIIQYNLLLLNISQIQHCLHASHVTAVYLLIFIKKKNGETTKAGNLGQHVDLS